MGMSVPIDADPASSSTPSAGGWGRLAPPADSRLTDFGATLFEVASMADPAPPGSGSVFDVCHAGVVLRALLFVHGVMATAAAFSASTFTGWLVLVAAGSSITLPAVLTWLLAACALQR